MTSEKSAHSVHNTARFKRLQISLNVLIQVFATFFIIGMINYLAFHHYQRWDFSRNQKYVLSDQTKNLLKGLNKKVKAIVFFSQGSEILLDIHNLLREYKNASKKKIEIEVVDPYRNLTRARELQAKYKFAANENLIILDYEDRSKFVNAADMALYDREDEQFGKPPRVIAFKGEQALTSALIEITDEKQSKVYVLSGQGQHELTSPALTPLKLYIERQNIKVETLNLMSVDAVPADAKAIINIGAKYDLSEREITLLKDYWEKKGRLLLLLDPSASAPHFNEFLNEQGVIPRNDRVLRTVNMGAVTGILREVTANFIEGSPITKQLKGVTTNFLGQTQSLALEQKRLETGNVRIQSLIEAAQGYWGETDYMASADKGFYYEPKKDHFAPLTIAASVEKGALNDPRVQVDSSRMIVVGNSEFITNEALNQASVDFALSSLNWLLDREELIGITPKIRNAFTLNLSQEQISNIALFTIMIIPAMVAVIGFSVCWARRY